MDGRIQELSLDRKNPTSYSFNKSKEEVLRSIDFLFSDFKHKGMGFYRSNSAKSNDYYTIYSLVGVNHNTNNVYLVPFEPIGKSKMYLSSKGDSLIYFVHFFELTIDSLKPEVTNVSIKTYGSEIIYDYELLPSLPHFNRKAKLKKK
jgi:hypothetical protein